MKSDYEYTLKGKQWELFDLMQQDKNCAFTISIRSGKTLLCFLYMVQQCLSKPNTNVVYLAPTQTMLKNIFVREHVVKLQGTSYCEVTDGEVRFNNGSRMIWLSAEKPERLRGLTIDVAVADECATMKADVVTELINRTAATPGREQGKVILITTPSGKNWYFDAIYGTEDIKGIIDNPYWHYRKYDAYEMGVIDNKTIERLRETKDEVSFEQDVLCNFSEVRGKIFKHFDESKHIQKCTYDRMKPIYIGMDFNHNPMTAVLAHKIKDSFYVFDEVYLKYSDTDETCEEINQRYNYPAVMVFPDASGGSASALGGKSRTNFKIIKKHFGENVIKAGAKNPPIIDTVNEVNELLKQDRFFVDPKCTNVIKSMLNYAWKEGSNQVDKNGFDHMADCVRYLVHGVFPLRKDIDLSQQPQYWNQVVRG